MTMPTAAAGRWSLHVPARHARVLRLGLAAVGYVYGLWVLLPLGIAGAGGSGGTDALAYLGAGRAILDGADPYGLAPGSTGAYLYTPLFAQVVAPLAVVPAPIFVWGWRLVEVACLRIAVGSWSRAGIAILVFPPVIIELAYANVNLMVAAICAWTMRGRTALAGVPVAVKAVGLPLIPLAFIADRTTFVRSWAAVLLAVGLSVLIAPALWTSYLAFLGQAPEPTWWTNLSGGVPLALRFAVAGVLGVAAIRWVRLAPVAVLIGQPIVWLTSLSMLVAMAGPIQTTNATSRPASSRPADGTVDA